MQKPFQGNFDLSNRACDTCLTGSTETLLRRPFNGLGSLGDAGAGKRSDEAGEGTDISRGLDGGRLGQRMQLKLTGSARPHEVKQVHQEVRGLSLAFTMRERLRASQETLFFAEIQDRQNNFSCLNDRDGRKGIPKPARGGRAESAREYPGHPTSPPFDSAVLRSGRPLKDFPSLGTRSRAKAHGQRP